jgi:hypothetical protein
MPTALVDFEAVYDGKVVRLEAGRDWVAPGHELVRRYRDRFAPDSFDVSVLRRRSRAPSAELAVEFRDVAPTYEVDLAYSVRPAIEEEIGDVLRHCGNVETGGFLFGHKPPRPDSASVCHASGPGRNSRHSRSGLKLSSLRTVESEFSDVVARAGLVQPVGGGRPIRGPLRTTCAAGRVSARLSASRRTSASSSLPANNRGGLRPSFTPS